MSDKIHTTIILKNYPAKKGWDAYLKYGDREFDSWGYRTRWGAKLSAEFKLWRVKRADRIKAKPVKVKKYEK